MFSRFSYCLATLTALMVVSPFSVSAQDAKKTDKKKTAYTSIKDAGPDFALQGEFTGMIQSALIADQQIGLRVISLGDGRFSAIEYPGGLPGEGWVGYGEIALSGERNGSSVQLAGYPYEISVNKGFATVYFSNGRSVGELKQVYRESNSLGAAAPKCAEVLFDGTDTKKFKNGRMDEEGNLMVGTQLLNSYKNYKLHVEFRLPYMPYASGQARANSGVYLNSRYEIQILDSYGLEGADNECGALYRLRKPDVNMCFPPLSWQSYDIEFRAAKFDEAGNKTNNARICVWHNGVLIHDNVEIERKTGGGAQEGPDALPIKFQNHGNPVAFRNIWILDHDQPPTCYCCCHKRKCYQVCECGDTGADSTGCGMDGNSGETGSSCGDDCGSDFSRRGYGYYDNHSVFHDFNKGNYYRRYK
jgi:hypothetical protein